MLNIKKIAIQDFSSKSILLQRHSIIATAE